MLADDPWMAAMRGGNFAEAWRISDEILNRRQRTGEACWPAPRHLQFIWTGASLEGQRVLVRCYHGLGDTLQFIRFAAPLRARAREVTVWAQPALVELISTAPGVDRVLPLHEGTVAADYDVDIEIMELSHALRLTPGSCSTRVPYLAVRRPSFRLAQGGGEVRVGIVWQAGQWDERRSLPTDLAARLATAKGTRFYSLQRGPARQKAGALKGLDVSSPSVTATAARMQGLDLVISVDTMTAHLAGALGVPVWTLLSADCDWRWMKDRADSPWYPTMRLFRQRRPGGWSEVVAEVREALEAWPA
jgi:hypothetical protein